MRSQAWVAVLLLLLGATSARPDSVDSEHLNLKGYATAQAGKVQVKERPVNVPSQTTSRSSVRFAQNGPAQPQEFPLNSDWEYVQLKPSAPNQAYYSWGHANIVDKSGAPIGAVGFYCTLPHSYVD